MATQLVKEFGSDFSFLFAYSDDGTCADSAHGVSFFRVEARFVTSENQNPCFPAAFLHNPCAKLAKSRMLVTLDTIFTLSLSQMALRRIN